MNVGCVLSTVNVGVKHYIRTLQVRSELRVTVSEGNAALLFYAEDAAEKPVQFDIEL